MRIVHVADYFQPQLGYQEYFTALAQVKDGHEVHVLTADRYRPFPDYEDSVRGVLGPRIVGVGIDEVDGLIVHRLPVRLEYAYRVWLRGLEARLAALQPDVVLVDGMANPSAIRTCLLKARLPQGRRFRLSVDDHMVPGISRHPLRGAFHAMFRAVIRPLLLRQVDALVAVSGPTRDFMVETYGLPADRVAVVPLGVDGDLFRRDEAVRAALRGAHGIGADDVVLVHAGKLIEEKAPHLLVDAALELLDELPHLRILVVGDGPAGYVGAMREKVAQRGHAARFLWVPAVPNRELARWYSVADIGVWPARSSGTMVEAQACGLPVVVSSFPAAAERAAGDRGVVFPEGDVGALADALRELATDPDRRARMGARARDEVLATLDYRILSRHTLELLGL